MLLPCLYIMLVNVRKLLKINRGLSVILHSHSIMFDLNASYVLCSQQRMTVERMVASHMPVTSFKVYHSLKKSWFQNH